MRVNKTLLAFTICAVMLSGCSLFDEKEAGLLEEGAKNEQNGTLTSAYSDGSSLSGEQFGNNRLGSEFSDPASPLSKRTIYFSYDSSQVRQDFIAVIAAHAQYLVKHSAQGIILEGHADERGTREYNIALGEQRGKSVYRMMKIQGVADNQLEVVSYGEEKPDADGMDEASWQLNRRVEIAYQGQ